MKMYIEQWHIFLIYISGLEVGYFLGIVTAVIIFFFSKGWDSQTKERLRNISTARQKVKESFPADIMEEDRSTSTPIIIPAIDTSTIDSKIDASSDTSEAGVEDAVRKLREMKDGK